MVLLPTRLEGRPSGAVAADRPVGQASVGREAVSTRAVPAVGLAVIGQAELVPHAAVEEAQTADVRGWPGRPKRLLGRLVEADLRAELTAAASAGLSGRIARGHAYGTLGPRQIASRTAAIALAVAYRTPGIRVAAGAARLRQGSPGRVVASVAHAVATSTPLPANAALPSEEVAVRLGLTVAEAPTQPRAATTLRTPPPVGLSAAEVRNGPYQAACRPLDGVAPRRRTPVASAIATPAVTCADPLHVADVPSKAELAREATEAIPAVRQAPQAEVATVAALPALP